MKLKLKLIQKPNKTPYDITPTCAFGRAVSQAQSPRILFVYRLGSPTTHLKEGCPFCYCSALIRRPQNTKGKQVLLGYLVGVHRVT